MEALKWHHVEIKQSVANGNGSIVVTHAFNEEEFGNIVNQNPTTFYSVTCRVGSYEWSIGRIRNLVISTPRGKMKVS